MNRQLTFLEEAETQATPKAVPKPVRQELDLGSIAIADLPESAQDMARLIGIEGVLRLVRNWGGSELYIPGSHVERSQLSRVLGKPSARLLAQHWGGTSIYIPALKSLRQLTRDRAARADYDRGGVTARELAIKYGVSTRRIKAILSEC